MTQIKGKTLKKKYVNKDNSNHVIDGNYVYVKLPKKLKNTRIQLMNIIPIHNGMKYKIAYVYATERNKINEYNKKDIKNYLFVDTGMSNLLTIYDPFGKANK